MVVFDKSIIQTAMNQYHILGDGLSFCEHFYPSNYMKFLDYLDKVVETIIDPMTEALKEFMIQFGILTEGELFSTDLKI